MIKKPEIEKIYNLTPMQEGMLFHSLMDDIKGTYFEQISFTIDGRLNVELFEKSLNIIIERYDILRTNFVYEKIRKPQQVVLKEQTLKVYYKDLSDIEESEQVIFEDSYREKDKEKGFDLLRDLLLRISVFKVKDEQYRILWSFHHILMDGWCIGIIIKDLFQIYISLRDNTPLQMEKVSSYINYIKWIDRQDKEEASAYWKEYLEDYDNKTTIPKIKNAQGDTDYKQNEFTFILDEPLTKELEAIARKASVTLNTIFQSIWGILLQRYNNTDDIVFGSVISSRPSEVAGIDRMVGLFINTIPVRIRCAGKQTFSELIQKVHESSILSKKYDYCSLANVQQLSKLRNDLIENIVGFENYPVEKELYSSNQLDIGLKISDLKSYSQTNYNFNVVVGPGKELGIKFKYNERMYDTNFVKKIEGHFKQIAVKIIKDPCCVVEDINILTEEETSQILFDFNDTKSEYPRNKIIHRLFEEQVKMGPDAIALVWNNEEVSYGELNCKANRLAGVLREKGVKPGDIVGLMIKRSIDAIVATLAILKTGAAYLPIDPDYPVKRIIEILDDSGAVIILSHSGMIRDLSFTALQNLDGVELNIKVTESRPQIMDLDNHPYPDRGLIDYSRYTNTIGLAPVKNSFAIQGSRGCPYNCAFCHKIWPKSHVVRSAEHIYEEVKYLYDAGVRKFTIVDDIFNLNVENSTRFFKLIIDNGLKVNFYFPNGVRGDRLTEDYIDLMVKAGTMNLSLALETASPRLQKLIGKNLDIEKLKHNLNYITTKHPHVILDLFFMIGFPTETEEEAMLTLNFVQDIKWLHFPVLNILKIYPNTDMEKLALQNGISKEAIRSSMNIAYHELPETLPFSKSFARKIQSIYFNDYFLSKERLSALIDVQRAAMTEEELVLKYNSYLPKRISSIQDLFAMAGMDNYQLLPDICPEFCEPINMDRLVLRYKKSYGDKKEKNSKVKILFLDLTQYFSGENSMLYDVAEPPLGQMYLLTYLKSMLGDQVEGKILKSRFDFNSYEELKQIIGDFKPDIIGARALTFYKDFYHTTLSFIRQWGINAPIIAGGPYATSDYMTLLNDRNIDIAILGEGEITLYEFVSEFIKNGYKMPSDEALKSIKGIAIAEKKGDMIDQHQPANKLREILLVDQIPKDLYGQQTDYFEEVGTSGDIAYIMYTSGSTGKPKGIRIMQKSVIRLVKNTNYISFKSDDKILQTGATVFDASTFEIWGALLNGLTLYLVDDDVILNPKKLAQALEKYKITTLWLTSPLFNLHCDENESMFGQLRNLLVGGDVLSPKHINHVRKRFLKLTVINGYGPTENTTFSVCYPIDKEYEDNIPIGKPISNSTAYIMDNFNHLQPIGVPGELCTGGDGVAKGYVNRPNLTTQKFIPNPFIKEDVLYKTGDLARWLPDGKIEFLGRKDEQVKIRGYRIELAEIESHLLMHDNISEAVVVYKEETNGNKNLCAYVVADKDLTVVEIIEYLARELPDYMIPTHFAQLGSMPLNVNGKVDRKALIANEEMMSVGIEYIKPEGQTEKKLANIWKEILDVDEIGANDNFFKLGGHSLLATIMISRIHKEFNTEITLSQLFKMETLRELAQCIEKFEKSTYKSIKPVEKREYYPASSAQKRMFIIDHLEENGTSYNMTGTFVIEGEVDKGILANALETLVKRHETLRTSFEIINNEVVQHVHDEIQIIISCIQQENTIDEAIQSFIKPFSLQSAPLFRVGLITLNKDRHILVFDMHHIIADAVSVNVITGELVKIYHNKELPQLDVQYRDFSIWQNELLKSDEIKKREKYWLNMLKGRIPVLNLSTDYPRSRMADSQGDMITCMIDEELTSRLNQIALNKGATLNIILLAGLNILLSKYTLQEEILIGCTVTGRTHLELQNIVGMFVNMLVLRNYPSPDKKLEDFLDEVKGNVLGAFENQDYQFEDILNLLGIERNVTRNPLFDVCFNMVKMEDNQMLALGKFKVKPYEFAHKTTKFDLTVNAFELGKQISMVIEYRTSLFKQETIEKLKDHYIEVLEQITKKPYAQIKQIEISREIPIVHRPADEAGDFNF